MNREELPRIRLKVATTAGINILCTALRKWKVSEWLPHIEEAFRQVRQDQGQDQHSKKTFIRALRLKKGDFYIANSQIIGDVFEDNDEVFCEIDFPGQSKKQIKENKKNKKAQHKTQNEKRKGKDNKKAKVQAEKNEEREGESQSEIVHSKPSKKKKIDKQKNHSEPKQIVKEEAIIEKKPLQQTEIPKESKPKIQNSTVEKGDKFKNNEKFVKVDLTKLKSLLIKSDKKIENSPKPDTRSPPKSKHSHSQDSS